MDNYIKQFSENIGYTLFILIYLYFWWDILSDSSLYAIKDLTMITWNILIKVFCTTVFLYFVLRFIVFLNKSCNPRYEDKDNGITLNFYDPSVFHIFKYASKAFLASIMCYCVTNIYVYFFVDKSAGKDKDEEEDDEDLDQKAAKDSYEAAVVRCILIANIILFLIFFTLLKGS